jgi:hypothetical protein
MTPPIPRESAIAYMVMYAMRIDDFGGLFVLEDILQGNADPERRAMVVSDLNVEYHANYWFCIVREGNDPPEWDVW